MTKYTETWGIASPDGSQQVAVPKDVSDNADTTDAALTQATRQFEASTRAALIASGVATEMVNEHPNPGAEYDNPSSMLAQGATSRTRTSEWVAHGAWSWKCVHTDATSYGPGTSAAFFLVGGNIPLNGADYAAARLTIHNAATSSRRVQVRLFAADTAAGGSATTDGTAVASTPVDIPAGGTQTVTLRAGSILTQRPTATVLRLQFWRLPGGGAEAGDIFHVDDALITFDQGQLPPEGQPFDGDQALFTWNGTPGFSPSTGLVSTGGGGGGGGKGIDTILHVDPTTGDDGNDGTTWSAPLATIDAAFSRIITGVPATVRLAPGIHTRPTKGLPSNTLLQGAGRDVTIIQAPPGYDTYAVLANANPSGGDRNFTIRDLTIDGNQANRPDSAGDWSSSGTTEPGTGLLLQRCGDFVLDNITVRGAVRRGMFIRGWSKNDWGRNGVLSNVYAIENGSAGIHVGNAQRAMFYKAVYAIGNGVRTTDYEGDPDLWGTGLAFDVSETTATGCYAYDNRGHGFYLRNVFSDNWTGLQANANDKHGILLSGITGSVGSAWSAHKNGRGSVDSVNYPDGWADIFFQDGTYNPSAGNYGETRETTIAGITAGITSTSNWPDFLDSSNGGTEAWGIYFQDATTAHGGPGRYLNTQLVGANVTPGTSGAIRMPSAPDHGVTVL